MFKSPNRNPISILLLDALLCALPSQAFYAIWGYADLALNIYDPAVKYEGAVAKSYYQRENLGGFHVPLCRKFWDPAPRDPYLDVRFLGFLTNQPAVLNPVRALGFYEENRSCSGDPDLIIYIPKSAQIEIYDLEKLGLGNKVYQSFRQFSSPQTNSNGDMYKDELWTKYIEPVTGQSRDTKKGFIRYWVPDATNPRRLVTKTLKENDYPKGGLKRWDKAIGARASQSTAKKTFEDLWYGYMRNMLERQQASEVGQIQDDEEEQAQENEEEEEEVPTRRRRGRRTRQNSRPAPQIPAEEGTDVSEAQATVPKIESQPQDQAQIKIEPSQAENKPTQSANEGRIGRSRGVQQQEDDQDLDQAIQQNPAISTSVNLDNPDKKVNVPINLTRYRESQKRQLPDFEAIYASDDLVEEGQETNQQSSANAPHQFRKTAPRIPTLDVVDVPDLKLNEPQIPPLDPRLRRQLENIRPNTMNTDDLGQIVRNYQAQIQNLNQFTPINPRYMQPFMDQYQPTVADQTELANLLAQNHLLAQLIEAETERYRQNLVRNRNQNQNQNQN